MQRNFKQNFKRYFLILDFGMSKLNSEHNEKVEDLRFLTDALSVLTEGLPCFGKKYVWKLSSSFVARFYSKYYFNFDILNFRFT